MAMRAVEVGHTVVGFEPDRNRLASLKAGTSYVEDVSSDTLQHALASGRYIATNDPAEIALFDVAVISVPTPLREHAPDLAFVRSATGMIGPHVLERGEPDGLGYLLAQMHARRRPQVFDLTHQARCTFLLDPIHTYIHTLWITRLGARCPVLVCGSRTVAVPLWISRKKVLQL
jgi:hypothetical protein